jgi:hypothetical protein
VDESIMPSDWESYDFSQLTVYPKELICKFKRG